MLVLDLLQDALFAALAAIGFAAISNPPKRAYAYCAIIAAAGHSLRFSLINWAGLHIVAATFCASLLIGLLAVLFSPRAKMPAETGLYPALLPMIPGIYAYKTFAALVMCTLHNAEPQFGHYWYLFASNGLTTFFILLGMAVGATIPIFVLPKIAFQATRSKLER